MIYMLLTVMRYIGVCLPDGNPIGYALRLLSRQYIEDIRTIPNFLCALLIFAYFVMKPVKTSRIVNAIAAPTFAVYIIHQVPAFYPYLWSNIFQAKKWTDAHSVFYVFFVVLAVYFVCGILDYFRRKYLEPIWIKSRIFLRSSRAIETIYEKYVI